MLSLAVIGIIGVILSAAPEPTPAEDLKTLQGAWTVSSTIPCVMKDVKLPDETRLAEIGARFSIRGNELSCDGKVIASLANDIAAPTLIKEIGFPYSRPLVISLPSGKGLLCSYYIKEDGVEIAYPHTTSCHRGSGQIVYLKRPK